MITITLPYPISANRYWRTRVIKPKAGAPIVSTYISPEAKEFKADVERIVRAAGVREPITGRVAIAYTLFPNRPQDFRTRMRKLGDAWHDTVQCIDLDNAQKVLLDALKGIAFLDDVWVRRITAERAEPDEHGARLVVTITQIGTPQPQVALDLDRPTESRSVAPSLFDPLEV
ncbi:MULTISPECIES: RusA family crossover junction endodeoxyribonuclease [unclassified Caballeronia]|uniref:RusA family crossover junction endodeoxyribonuclease n=1 Tax=unclassified Caballeronia TaxID=2646786 RepID=UPI001F1C9B87|nr:MULTISPECIES: RusA family crossover junction endodeoxyribonuclease [unclassified Caballeronia]MCE4544610.1 RusA family crossover junction endodeoxyribonuclease [Caballeronia sp. PC1]MCE4571762.1 RusA family crossover junction endodeoxyribonuclease [Caballeronia sp. CLC5]